MRTADLTSAVRSPRFAAGAAWPALIATALLALVAAPLAAQDGPAACEFDR